MYLDKELLFSDAQAITAAAGSTNTIDLNEVRDIGTGHPLKIVLVVDTTFADSGSNSTLTVALEGDSTESFTPDGTQDLGTIPALTEAGTKFEFYLDPGAAPLQYRYIRLKYTPNNGNLSAGAVTAGIVIDAEKHNYFPSGFEIS